jgi:formylglycine-generating enzyme required for sulfatase activity
VNLPGYWIGRTEVTNAEYLRFVQATGHGTPDHWKGGFVPTGVAQLPVVDVSWYDARAYCDWAGGHLPTELQWEKAARGTDGRIFPWGNEWDSKRCRNFDEVTMLANPHLDTVRDAPAAAGSYPAGASPYGCADMAGNVWEWCADSYDGAAYRRYARGDLTPPKTREFKAVRGGSWIVADPKYFRCARRANGGSAGGRFVYYGFRCAHAGRP